MDTPQKVMEYIEKNISINKYNSVEYRNQDDGEER